MVPNNDNDTKNNAPACFGSISCFSSDSEHCKKCVAFTTCEARSIETLHSIKSIVNVDDLLRKHRLARLKEKEKREKARAEMNKAKEVTYAPPQPKMPQQTVERATKVEKVVLEVTAEDQAMVERLPVKAQPIALSWLKNGVIHEIREGLRENKNAMADKKPVWLDKLVDGLLKGGFTKTELRDRFMNELGWSEGTAASHVSLGLALLFCFKIIKQDNTGRVISCLS